MVMTGKRCIFLALSALLKSCFYAVASCKLQKLCFNNWWMRSSFRFSVSGRIRSEESVWKIIPSHCRSRQSAISHSKFEFQTLIFVLLLLCFMLTFIHRFSVLRQQTMKDLVTFVHYKESGKQNDKLLHGDTHISRRKVENSNNEFH